MKDRKARERTRKELEQKFLHRGKNDKAARVEDMVAPDNAQRVFAGVTGTEQLESGAAIKDTIEEDGRTLIEVAYEKLAQRGVGRGEEAPFVTKHHYNTGKVAVSYFMGSAEEMDDAEKAEHIRKYHATHNELGPRAMPRKGGAGYLGGGTKKWNTTVVAGKGAVRVYHKQVDISTGKGKGKGGEDGEGKGKGGEDAEAARKRRLEEMEQDEARQREEEEHLKRRKMAEVMEAYKVNQAGDKKAANDRDGAERMRLG